jgi:hypothetical protein
VEPLTQQTTMRFLPEARDVVTALRSTLLTLAPDARERANPTAGSLSFGYGARPEDQICTLMPAGGGVALVFFAGRALPDPEGLLSGTGVVHRSLLVDSPQQACSAAVVELLRHAAAACRERRSAGRA